MKENKGDLPAGGGRGIEVEEEEGGGGYGTE